MFGEAERIFQKDITKMREINVALLEKEVKDKMNSLGLEPCKERGK